jgi:hypothetical protein
VRSPSRPSLRYVRARRVLAPRLPCRGGMVNSERIQPAGTESLFWITAPKSSTLQSNDQGHDLVSQIGSIRDMARGGNRGDFPKKARNPSGERAITS